VNGKLALGKIKTVGMVIQKMFERALFYNRRILFEILILGGFGLQAREEHRSRERVVNFATIVRRLILCARAEAHVMFKAVVILHITVERAMLDQARRGEFEFLVHPSRLGWNLQLEARAKVKDHAAFALERIECV
jgi:hypothetical protein